jgi:hypothetical protein
MSDASLTKYGKATACTAFAKVKINGKCYCKRHGLLKIWNMLFVDKTHTLEVIKK